MATTSTITTPVIPNMNEKSKVTNLCDFPVSWKRETAMGDEYIKANGIAYILNQELETQKDNGNKFIAGIDGLGSHALIYIENPELREYFEFDNKSEKRTQLIVDEEKCKSILEIKTLSTFKKNLTENIVTEQEKMKIMNVARKIKIDEYSKIEVLEEYTGMKFKV